MIMLKISTFETRFIDSEGRQRIFNGMNLCDKGYHVPGNERKTYDVPFDENLISKLSGYGFNIVRLGLTWDAVEPQPNQYDEKYLDKIQKVADLCEKYGIYFFLDMHQDLYGGTVDTPADGAPAWACLTDGAKFKPTRIVWAEGYFWGKAIHNCFDNFWADKEYNGVPLQTYFCNMWKHVAERFKDHPALFGFDILNEPFPGSDGGKIFRKLIMNVAKTVITDKRCKKLEMLRNLVTGNAIKCLDPFDDPSLFRKVTSAGDELIHKFDTGAYSKFINKTAKAIREVTDNGIIIMENSYYSNLGIPYSAPAVNYDGKREEKLCFAPSSTAQGHLISFGKPIGSALNSLFNFKDEYPIQIRGKIQVKENIHNGILRNKPITNFLILVSASLFSTFVIFISLAILYPSFLNSHSSWSGP